jgi:hypothetical protein
LGGALRLEPLLLSFSSSNDEMGVFSPIVLKHGPGSVMTATAKVTECSPVRCEPVRRDCLEVSPLALQKLAQQSYSGNRVSPLLD